MALGDKKDIEKKQQERKEELEAARESYRKILKTDAMQELIRFSSAQSQTYLTAAMRETERDKKCTLIDTAAGVMTVLNHITEMSKPDSGRRTQKGKTAKK